MLLKGEETRSEICPRSFHLLLLGLGLELEIPNLNTQNVLAHRLTHSKSWLGFFGFVLFGFFFLVCFYSHDKSIDYSPNLPHRTALSPVV